MFLKIKHSLKIKYYLKKIEYYKIFMKFIKRI